MPGFRGVVPIALFLAGSSPGAAQPPRHQIIVDAVYASRLLWRGVPRVSNPVTQAAATAVLEVPAGHLSLGIWSAIEFHGPEESEFSIAGSDQRLAEIDYTLQYAARRGEVDLVGGISHYDLRNDVAIGTLGPSFSTTELYAAVSVREGLLRSLGFTPSVRAWFDVDKVGGGYAEFELTYEMPVVPIEKPLVGIHLSVRSGLSLGQSTADGATGYFDEDGFTHVETSALLTGRITPWLGVGFNWRLSFGLDPATQRGDPRSVATDRSSWGWIETWVTLRLPGRTW